MIGALGMGWSHNYENHIEQADDDLMHVSPSGIEFFSSEDGISYHSRFGGRMRIVKTDSGYLYADRLDNIQYEYDTAGRLTTISGKGADRIAFEYEEVMLCRATDQYNNYIEYHYGENGLLSDVESSKGDVCRFEYTGACISQVHLGDAFEQGFEYDENGYLSRYILADGTIDFSIVYDEDGKVLKQTFADESVTLWEYEDDKVIYVDELGNRFVYYHDEKNRHTATEYPDGTSDKYEYDSNNNVVLIKGRNNVTVVRKYDEEGRLIAETSGSGNTTKYEYENNLYVPSRIIFPDGGVKEIKYDHNGNVLMESAVSGLIVSYEYDDFGRPEKRTYNNGVCYELSYDNRGNVVSETKDNCLTRRFEYNESDDLILVTEADGSSVKFEYYNNGKIKTKTNELGQIKEYAYDEYGNVSKIVDYDGYFETYSYDEKNRLSQTVDKSGNITEYKYDACSRRIGIILPNGACIRYERDSMGRVTKEIAPDGEVTAYEYDESGLLRRVSYGGSVQKYSYSEDKRTIIIEDNLGNTRKKTHAFRGHIIREVFNGNRECNYVYDEAGRCTAVTDATGKTTKFEYDEFNHITTQIGKNGHINCYEYDSYGNIISSTDENGVSITYGYDISGNVNHKRYHNGYEIFSDYDMLGRETARRDSSGHQLGWEYDAAGNVVKSTDSYGRTVEYQYSPNGMMVSACNQLGQITDYTYDKIGNLSGIDAGDGHTISFTRTAGGKITSVVDSMGNSHHYSYDLSGNMTKSVDAEGKETAYVYDSVGNVLSIQYPDGRVSKFEYDSNNRITKINDWNGPTIINYNDDGLITDTLDYAGRSIKYVYGVNGLLNQIIYLDGNIAFYEYDEHFRKSKVSFDNIAISFKYDEFGRLSEKVYGNGVVEKYTYDLIGHLIENELSRDDAVIKKIVYLYDLNGNIVSKEISDTDDKKNSIFNYDYDELNRLVAVYENGSEISKYEYDKWGNRILGRNRKCNCAYTYNELNQLVECRDTITGEILFSYAYDKNGSLIAKNGGESSVKYIYDAAGKLSAVETIDSRVSLLYDALGNRVSENGVAKGKVIDKNYAINYASPLFRVIGTISEGAFTDYLWDTKLSAVVSDNESLYTISDNLGSITDALGADGLTLGHRVYDEFGALIDDTLDVPFGYTGYLNNSFDSSYNAGARNYDPIVGRFVSKDDERYIHTSIPQSVNLYSYCYNNPVIYVDPEGNDCYIFTSNADAMSKSYANYSTDYLAEYYHCSSDEIHVIDIETTDDFINGWNSMGDNGRSIDTVIIEAHGGWGGFATGNGYNISEGDIDKLNDKVVGEIVMSVCNAGNLENANGGTMNGFEIAPNPASSIAKKVNGAPVIAADGDVDMGTSILGIINYANKNHKQKVVEGPGNKGWVIYQEKDDNVTTKVLNEYSMNLEDMLKQTSKYHSGCYRRTGHSGIGSSGGGHSGGGSH